LSRRASRERGIQASHISTTSSTCPVQRKFIVKLDPLPDAVKPGFHCARTHWIRDFMAFGRVRDARVVMLMVPM
jgi:hypothetical protein